MPDYTSLFPTLNSESRVWIYVAPEVLDPGTASKLRTEIESFGQNWSSHGRQVHSEFELLESQIGILSAQVQQGEISGCGIDKSLHTLDAFAARNDFNWVGPLSVVYRDEKGALRIVTRPEFRSLVKAGLVTELTPVLDVSITTLDQLRAGKLEVSAGQSWHAQVFGITSSMSV